MTNENSDASLTIDQFCKIENLSRYSFFRLRQRGLAPRLLHVPGTRILRVTPEARRQWHLRMEALEKEQAAALEQAQRVEQARRAGQASARSPLHVSRSRRDR